jgi:hypothetical protein
VARWASVHDLILGLTRTSRDEDPVARIVYYGSGMGIAVKVSGAPAVTPLSTFESSENSCGIPVMYVFSSLLG